MADFPKRLSSTGIYHTPDITIESAEKVSSLLQLNHDSFNIFWNYKTYHNHQVHYLLTAYALGATPEQLQVAFDGNAGYQRPRLPVDRILVGKLQDERYFKSMIASDTGDNWFNDFTAFFQGKIKEQPWPVVVNQYLFSRTEIAEQLLVGLFAGVIHPLIHFGFGIEFEQPAVIAESLAMGATHNKYFGPFLHRAEHLATAKRRDRESPPLIDLLREVRAEPSLHSVEYWDGGDSLNDKILADAPEKLCQIAAKWTVDVNQIELKTAEMINVNAFITGAAQRKDKKVKLDFFFIHCINAAIFFSVFNAQSWLSPENKARILEWKGRSDILTYASRCAPELHPEEITQYKPQQQGETTWSSIIARTTQLTHDDGHIAKLIRALAHGANVCAPFEGRKDLEPMFPCRGADWLQIANMALDTTTELRVPDRWMRGAGAAKNWDNVAALV